MANEKLVSNKLTKKQIVSEILYQIWNEPIEKLFTKSELRLLEFSIRYKIEVRKERKKK